MATGIVVLVSGGLDSTLISVMAKREGVQTYPLFIDYGQLCAEREWAACLAVHKVNDLPDPVRMSMKDFGRVIPSGLTDASRDIVADAFLPCRNLLFAVCGAAYAYSKGAESVVLGLIDESQAIFPDQTTQFVQEAEQVVRIATGRPIRVVTPLLSLSKGEIIALSEQLGIHGTYSCHRGTAEPCGRCISCMERIRASQSA
jgi:7-cyano-7-deazaguanine synthase